MFKFGFFNDQDENIAEENSNLQQENRKWFESNEIIPDTLSNVDKIIQNCSTINLKCGNNLTLKYLHSKDISKILKTDSELCSKNSISFINADQNHSDLVTSIYEGGLKIWECTFDLIDYIINNKLDFNNKKVLDLGCGAGIIGIFAILKNSECYFQDYNAEVLKYVTIPNAKLNCGNFENAKFFSGDWSFFSNLITNQYIINESDKFDYIFTSETIYNTENYNKLHKLFENLLKKNGTIYLAAKSYYFGVGGGIPQFQDLLKKEGLFEFKTTWKCSEGVKREIIEINFKFDNIRKILELNSKCLTLK